MSPEYVNINCFDFIFIIGYFLHTISVHILSIIQNILHLLKQFKIVIVNPEIIYDAVACCILNRIAFWDSIIVTAQRVPAAKKYGRKT